MITFENIGYPDRDIICSIMSILHLSHKSLYDKKIDHEKYLYKSRGSDIIKGLKNNHWIIQQYSADAAGYMVNASHKIVDALIKVLMKSKKSKHWDWCVLLSSLEALNKLEKYTHKTINKIKPCLQCVIDNGNDSDGVKEYAQEFLSRLVNK